MCVILPETNSFAPETDGWLEDDEIFFWGLFEGLFFGAFAVSFREGIFFPLYNGYLDIPREKDFKKIVRKT